MRVVLLLCIAAVLGACDEGTSRVRGVSCASNYECTVGAVLGTCQSNGFCAYPDATCAGGSRYSPGAGDVASQCVGGTCGGIDEACCAQSTCNDGLGCNGATCTCGDAEGQPCCGTTCGTNLACNTAGTCACGGPGEPCCDGTTCDGGATCTAGTCAQGWTKIAVGRHFICGVRSDGTVACWGNDRFQYGRSRPDQTIPVINTLTPTTIANAINVADIDAGEGNACIRKTDNTLWCWGHGSMGQLGNGEFKRSSVAVQVSGLSNVTNFSVGRQHICAVGTVGGVNGLYCWGHNGQRNHNNPNTPAGRIGNGTTADVALPTAVDPSQMSSSGQTVKDVVASGYHTCALMSDDRVWCWGYNSGNLGTNNGGDTVSPVLVDLSQITIPTGVTIDEIAANTSYATNNPVFIRLSNGTVHPWGRANGAALGDGTSLDRLRPASVVAGGHVFTKVEGAVYGGCGIDNAGVVWCWGDGFAGQLGNGDTTAQSTPVQVMLPANTTVAQLSLGHRMGCVLDSTHRIWCWGNNRKGMILRRAPTTDEEMFLTIPVEVL